MKEVKVKTLTAEAFRDLGTFMSVTDPQGYALEGTYHTFYRDQVKFIPNTEDPVCFSVLTVRKNPEFVISCLEYHDHTEEIQLPMDSDVVLCCAPANDGDLDPEQVEAFLIPKGTLLCLKRGTWHDVLYPVGKRKVNVLIGLPERIYHNDIVVKEVPDTKIKLIFD